VYVPKYKITVPKELYDYEWGIQKASSAFNKPKFGIRIARYKNIIPLPCLWLNYPYHCKMKKHL
jgi:hypothetical protein